MPAISAFTLFRPQTRRLACTPEPSCFHAPTARLSARCYINFKSPRPKLFERMLMSGLRLTHRQVLLLEFGRCLPRRMYAQDRDQRPIVYCCQYDLQHGVIRYSSLGLLHYDRALSSDVLASGMYLQSVVKLTSLLR